MRRYDEIARIVTGDSHVRADDGVEWVSDLTLALSIPPLRSYGISESDLSEIVEKSASSSSMQGNPVKLTSDELRSILEEAL
jgi:alcohol dehydrogenase class IV